MRNTYRTKNYHKRAGVCLKGWNNNMPIRGLNYWRAENMVFRSDGWQEYYDYYLA